ncbi:putative epimerase/dehydratase [Halobacteriovorax marinus SJ]|uniref:Epimerase/dehydratase n=1 Tax=Halobacteriovorax marinus (strain ATCC BAA-682 / DSM 15412 / SJ) TaxID=862908 RepID=E1X3V1_HALMS|nr:NAD-dependent epimerase/dehydratase family protein [Halobacteriovorax marinus]CBW25291.1 putative epimerase/dehydratase [Halobacteriovorax marinus SJ]
MKILVTGGEGYVGGRVTSYLRKSSKFEVVTTSTNKDSSNSIYFDLCDDSNLFDKVRDVDTLVHLASVNEVVCAQDPEKALNVNTLGSFKLIRDAIEAGVRRIIYFSTAHVYMSPLVGNIFEETATRSTHPYSYTHKFVEDYLFTAHDKGDVEAVVLRLTNSFGAPEKKSVNRWTLLVNDLCKKVVHTKELHLKSSGVQKRDFITLTDVSRAVEHFVNLDIDKIENGLFNLGGENSMRVIDMTTFIQERCEAVLGFKPEIITPSLNSDEASEELNISIEKLKKTGFRLENNIKEEIDRMLLFCKDNFKE